MDRHEHTVCNVNENLLRSYYGLQIMAWTKTHFPLTVKLKWRAHLIYYLWLCQVCVSPTMSDVSETKSTLFFGSRAMKITNTAYINVEVRVMLQRIICVGVLFRLDKWKLLIRARYLNFTLYENVVAIEREFFCGAHLMNVKVTNPLAWPSRFFEEFLTFQMRNPMF